MMVGRSACSKEVVVKVIRVPMEGKDVMVKKRVTPNEALRLCEGTQWRRRKR